MRLVKAMVRPNKVDEIRDALGEANMTGVTVTEVRGHGRQKGHRAVYRGREYTVGLLAKIESFLISPGSTMAAPPPVRRGPGARAAATRLVRTASR